MSPFRNPVFLLPFIHDEFIVWIIASPNSFATVKKDASFLVRIPTAMPDPLSAIISQAVHPGIRHHTIHLA